MILTLPELMAQISAHIRCLEIAAAVEELGAQQGHVIDVRETGEHRAGAVEGAINIPRGVL